MLPGSSPYNKEQNNKKQFQDNRELFQTGDPQNVLPTDYNKVIAKIGTPPTHTSPHSIMHAHPEPIFSKEIFEMHLETIFQREFYSQLAATQLEPGDKESLTNISICQDDDDSTEILLDTPDKPNIPIIHLLNKMALRTLLQELFPFDRIYLNAAYNVTLTADETLNLSITQAKWNKILHKNVRSVASSSLSFLEFTANYNALAEILCNRIFKYLTASIEKVARLSHEQLLIGAFVLALKERGSDLQNLTLNDFSNYFYPHSTEKIKEYESVVFNALYHVDKEVRFEPSVATMEKKQKNTEELAIAEHNKKRLAQESTAVKEYRKLLSKRGEISQAQDYYYNIFSSQTKPEREEHALEDSAKLAKLDVSIEEVKQNADVKAYLALNAQLNQGVQTRLNATNESDNNKRNEQFGSLEKREKEFLGIPKSWTDKVNLIHDAAFIFDYILDLYNEIVNQKIASNYTYQSVQENRSEIAKELRPKTERELDADLIALMKIYSSTMHDELVNQIQTRSIPDQKDILKFLFELYFTDLYFRDKLQDGLEVKGQLSMLEKHISILSDQLTKETNKHLDEWKHKEKLHKQILLSCVDFAYQAYDSEHNIATELNRTASKFSQLFKKTSALSSKITEANINEFKEKMSSSNDLKNMLGHLYDLLKQYPKEINNSKSFVSILMAEIIQAPLLNETISQLLNGTISGIKDPIEKFVSDLKYLASQNIISFTANNSVASRRMGK